MRASNKVEEASDLAVKAARAGAVELTSRFGTALTHSVKSHLDFATEADLEAEQAVRAVLRAGSPWPITGEEFGSTGIDVGGGLRWFVDPLCGTNNFANGIRFFCVNVALCRDGMPMLGVSLDPAAGELFSGVVGEGAWLMTNDGVSAPLQPSENSRMVDVDFAHASPDRAAYQTYRLPLLSSFAERYIPVRFASSLSIAYVAAGRLAAFIDDGDDMDVHFAAGAAIVRAAGGTALDLTGSDWHIGSTGIIAAATTEVANELLGTWREVSA